MARRIKAAGNAGTSGNVKDTYYSINSFNKSSEPQACSLFTALTTDLFAGVESGELSIAVARLRVPTDSIPLSPHQLPYRSWALGLGVNGAAPQWTYVPQVGEVREFLYQVVSGSLDGEDSIPVIAEGDYLPDNDANVKKVAEFPQPGAVLFPRVIDIHTLNNTEAMLSYSGSSFYVFNFDTDSAIFISEPTLLFSGWANETVVAVEYHHLNKELHVLVYNSSISVYKAYLISSSTSGGKTSFNFSSPTIQLDINQPSNLVLSYDGTAESALNITIVAGMKVIFGPPQTVHFYMIICDAALKQGFVVNQVGSWSTFDLNNGDYKPIGIGRDSSADTLATYIAADSNFIPPIVAGIGIAGFKKPSDTGVTGIQSISMNSLPQPITYFSNLQPDDPTEYIISVSLMNEQGQFMPNPNNLRQDTNWKLVCWGGNAVPGKGRPSLRSIKAYDENNSIDRVIYSYSTTDQYLYTQSTSAVLFQLESQLGNGGFYIPCIADSPNGEFQTVLTTWFFSYFRPDPSQPGVPDSQSNVNRGYTFPIQASTDLRAFSFYYQGTQENVGNAQLVAYEYDHTTSIGSIFQLAAGDESAYEFIADNTFIYSKGFEWGGDLFKYAPVPFQEYFSKRSYTQGFNTLPVLTRCSTINQYFGDGYNPVNVPVPDITTPANIGAQIFGHAYSSEAFLDNTFYWYNYNLPIGGNYPILPWWPTPSYPMCIFYDTLFFAKPGSNDGGVTLWEICAVSTRSSNFNTACVPITFSAPTRYNKSPQLQSENVTAMDISHPGIDHNTGVNNFTAITFTVTSVVAGTPLEHRKLCLTWNPLTQQFGTLFAGYVQEPDWDKSWFGRIPVNGKDPVYTNQPAYILQSYTGPGRSFMVDLILDPAHSGYAKCYFVSIDKMGSRVTQFAGDNFGPDQGAISLWEYSSFSDTYNNVMIDNLDASMAQNAGYPAGDCAFVIDACVIYTPMAYRNSAHMPKNMGVCWIRSCKYTGFVGAQPNMGDQTNTWLWYSMVDHTGFGNVGLEGRIAPVRAALPDFMYQFGTDAQPWWSPVKITNLQQDYRQPCIIVVRFVRYVPVLGQTPQQTEEMIDISYFLHVAKSGTEYFWQAEMLETKYRTANEDWYANEQHVLQTVTPFYGSFSQPFFGSLTNHVHAQGNHVPITFGDVQGPYSFQVVPQSEQLSMVRWSVAAESLTTKLTLSQIFQGSSTPQYDITEWGTYFNTPVPIVAFQTYDPSFLPPEPGSPQMLFTAVGYEPSTWTVTNQLDILAGEQISNFVVVDRNGTPMVASDLNHCFYNVSGNILSIERSTPNNISRITGYAVAPKTNAAGPDQAITGIQYYVNQFNAALNYIIANEKPANWPTAAPTPFFSFDSTQKAFVLHVPEQFWRQTPNSPALDFYVDDELQQILQMPLVQYNTPSAVSSDGTQNLWKVATANPAWKDGDGWYTVYQEGRSIGKLFDIARIFVEAPGLPVNGTLEGSNSNVQCITDIFPDVDSIQPGTALIFAPFFDRWYLLQQRDPIQRINVALKYQTRSGEVFPIYVNPNDFWGVLLVFRRAF